MMKRFAVFIGLLSICGPAYSEVHHRISNSVQLTVDGASSIATRVPSTISVSGSNIKVGSGNNDTFAGLTAGSGNAFTFSNSYLQGDPIATLNAGSTVSTTTGQVQSIPAYGITSTFAGGTKSTLAGTLTSANGGSSAVVAGGAGTTAIMQYTQEISVR